MKRREIHSEKLNNVWENHEYTACMNMCRLSRLKNTWKHRSKMPRQTQTIRLNSWISGVFALILFVIVQNLGIFTHLYWSWILILSYYNLYAPEIIARWSGFLLTTNGRFYTRERITRLDELGKTFIIRLQCKDGHKPHYPSRRAIFCFESFKSLTILHSSPQMSSIA